MEKLEMFLNTLKNENKIKKESKKLKPLLLKNNLIELDKNGLKRMFKAIYQIKYNKDYNEDYESDSFLNILLDYFYKNEDFYNSHLLYKKNNKPSLDKGLLIIGPSGLGKSSTLNTFYEIFNNYCVLDSSYRFRKISTQELVLKFENKENHITNADFFNCYKTGFLFIDDVKSERIASNYGNYNLVKEILQLRYENQSRTIITCNYKEGHSNELIKALDEFGEIYDSRVYDRVFELFNIIHLNKTSER